MNRPSLAPIAADRRFWLLLAIAALAGATGFRLIPDSYALTFVSTFGYWFILAAFSLFLWSLWNAFRPELKALTWKTFDGATLAVIGLCEVILLVHESFGFKIVMDEIMLLGTSMSMHLSRLALVPMRGNDIQGAFTILSGTLDKRPLFFPFLVSVLHDLTGYRPENAFILNGILTFIFLCLIALAGRLFAGRLGGILGVILFGGLPLLAQNATGGGFDLLNIVMILATLLLGCRYVSRRDGLALSAFCYSAVLMIEVRYESAVFFLPVAILVLWVWWREGKADLPWPVLIAPLLLLIFPVHHRIFDLNDSSWQLASKPGYDKPFSLAYIPENLAHATSFFFGKPTDQPNSWLLSGLGCLGVLFSLLLTLHRVKTLPKEKPITVAFTVFLLGFAAQFALMMCYFWGKFDDPVIRRLSLPTHLWLVLSVLYVLPEFSRKVVVPKVLIAIAALAVVIQGVPSMAAHAYNQEYLAGLETAWRRQFIADHPRRDYLAIDNDSVLWISHQVSSTPVEQAIHRKSSIVFLEKNRTFSDIFVFQRFMVDPTTNKLTLREGDDLGPDFVLEPVVEERLQLLTLSRISRVKEIREGGVAVKPDAADHAVPVDPAVQERVRQEYFENYLRQLP